jgi:signal transduction histidine kinase
MVRTYTFLGFKLGALTAVVMSLGGLGIVALLMGGVYAHCHSINTKLAAISHDLRSPLGAIQGYLETILEKGDGLSQQERERFMKVALRSTRSATSLINDVHHLSKLEANEEAISHEPLDITDLIMDTLMSLKPASDAKRLRVESDVPPVLPICVGNVELLERLVRNLLENAIRYTPDGGRIRVELANASTAVRITVVDSGIGIPKSELDKVGKAFFRGAGATQTAPGSGLGLSIAASIARLHGGELKILSRESHGTAIVFTVPALPARMHRARMTV